MITSKLLRKLGLGALTICNELVFILTSGLCVLVCKIMLVMLLLICSLRV